ncbi:MAG TPA: hypothetical protein VHU83_23690 [Bryobacteraceae bacterium]|nr:hypothetical protein [Bryobacteraceae bacterium]
MLTELRLPEAFCGLLRYTESILSLEIIRALWQLYRTYRTDTAPLMETSAEHIVSERSAVRPLIRGAGGETSFESHGKRCAWIHACWSDGGQNYPGLEYKGVGNFDGSPVYERRSGPHEILVGGQRFDWAQEEFHTSRQLWHAGVNCQRPLALFRLQWQGVSIPAGLFVRASRSPIRLIDFWKDPQILEEYLAITGEDAAQWSVRLGRGIGASLRTMFELGCAKPVEIDNTSSEGELLDFEHVWNGWFYGQPMPACYPLEAVRPLFREFAFVMGPSARKFETAFSESFCGRASEGDTAEQKALFAVEAYLGRELCPSEKLAPVDDRVRIKLLEDWTRALEFYVHLKTGTFAWDGAPGTQFVLRNLDRLIAITKEDLARMRARVAKVITE